MINRLFAIAFALILTACTVSDDTATEVLRKQGFTDVQTTGYAWFACSESDTFQSTFTATNPNGERVDGTICCGWMKSCTVRW